VPRMQILLSTVIEALVHALFLFQIILKLGGCQQMQYYTVLSTERLKKLLESF
jgi:hypothetical protein